MNHNQATNDLEQCRHSDVNLRRALQQRYADVPTLPEGFHERMLQRMTSEPVASTATTTTSNNATSQDTKRRTLWPRVAVAAAIVLTAVGVGTVLWQRPGMPQTASETAPQGQEMAQASVRTTRGADRRASMRATQQDGVKSHVTTPGQPSVQAGSDAHSIQGPRAEGQGSGVPDTAAPGNDVPATIESGTAEVATPDALAADEPDATPEFRLDNQRIHNLIAQETERAEQHTRLTNRQIALALRIGPDGGSINMPDNRDYATMPNDIYVHTKPANYYFASGNGYTYDFSNGEDEDEDDNDVSPSAQPQKAPPTGSASTSEKHRMPVSVGLAVQWQLTERLALETGLTYTRLASSFDHIGASSNIHQEQRVHYLGIPARLHVQLFQRNRWSGYGTGGGSIELPVAASLSTTEDDVRAGMHATRTEAVKSHPSAPVQFSVLAGVGVQYSLAPHIALYAEPSVQWFVPTGSDISTYRTEHPLTFIPAVGLRWEMGD